MAERTFEWYKPVVNEQKQTVIQPRNCTVCKTPIPLERLEVLPDTQTCVAHSNEQAAVCFEVFSHKTAPTLVRVNPADKEALRRAQRAHRRAR